MSEAEYPLTPAQAAAQARRDYPQLAAFTKPSVDADEQQRLYQANRRGLHLPLGMKTWRLSTRMQDDDLDTLRCPHCGHWIYVDGFALAETTRACDGCSQVSLLPEAA